MNVIMIGKKDAPEWVVLPYEDYVRMLAQVEELKDITDFDRITAAIDAGEETIPADVVYNWKENNTHPIKGWREYRGLTQAELAKAAGISTPYLAQIEGGTRKGSIATLQKVAQALRVSVNDLLE